MHTGRRGRQHRKSSRLTMASIWKRLFIPRQYYRFFTAWYTTSFLLIAIRILATNLNLQPHLRLPSYLCTMPIIITSTVEAFVLCHALADIITFKLSYFYQLANVRIPVDDDPSLLWLTLPWCLISCILHAHPKMALFCKFSSLLPPSAKHTQRTSASVTVAVGVGGTPGAILHVIHLAWHMDTEDGSSRLEVGNVRLLQNPIDFRAAFARFDDFSLNGWSEQKHQRIGAVGAITQLHPTDRTCTIHFDDGVEERYPYEAVANQLTRWKSGNIRRHRAVELLRAMVGRLNNEQDVDAFDMLALDPHAPHRPFAGNATRAAICAVIQICVPIALGASITYRILFPDEYEGTQPLWRNFCDLREAWRGQRLLLKLINKFVASTLLLYTYNFLETRTYHWKHKPTYQLLKDNHAFAVMEKPVWSAVGVITNGLALALCGFVNIIVIFFSDSKYATRPQRRHCEPLTAKSVALSQVYSIPYSTHSHYSSFLISMTS